MLILKFLKIILIYFLKNAMYYYINIHKKKIERDMENKIKG